MPAFKSLIPCRGILGLLLSIASIQAAALERDLEDRLRYHRVHELPADLPAADSARQRPWVLDLRFVAADAAESAAVQRWLQAGAGPRNPVFVLVNRETSGDLLRILNELVGTPGLLTLGVPVPLFQPDIVVQQRAEDERRAYDAIANGAPLTAVLRENPEKERNDEASLSRDRLAAATADLSGEQGGTKPDRPPVDLALQRAVHLYRSLLALKKI